MADLINISNGFERYSDIAETMNKMINNGESNEAIAKALGLSVKDMIVLRNLLIVANHATARLDTFYTYVSNRKFNGVVTPEAITKTAKELGVPESTVFHNLQKIAETYLNTELWIEHSIDVDL